MYTICFLAGEAVTYYAHSTAVRSSLIIVFLMSIQLDCSAIFTLAVLLYIRAGLH